MSSFRGVVWYEFRMQARRPALWLALAVTCGIVLRGVEHPSGPPGYDTAWSKIFPVALQLMVPIVIGLLLSDRLTRDRQLRTRDLIDVSGVTARVYVWGKYLGAVGATSVAALVPVTLIVLGELGVGQISGDIGAARDTLVGFLLMALPAYLFIGAYSLLLPSIMPLRLYQILFPCYWLWMHQGRVRSLAGTPLAPSGPYAQSAFLSLIHHRPYEQVRSSFGMLLATPAMAALNIILLLALAVLALVALEARLRRQQARQ